MSRYLMGAILALCLTAPVHADELAFRETSGPWVVAGDPGLAACLALGANNGSGTDLKIVRYAADENYLFVLSNPAWKSLEVDDLRIKAVFLDSAGQPTDLWDLSATGDRNSDGLPMVKWSINRAQNDGESFVRQFSRASEIYFARGEVPIALFDLTGSAGAIAALDRCTTQNRLDRNYDPFAK